MNLNRFISSLKNIKPAQFLQAGSLLSYALVGYYIFHWPKPILIIVFLFLYLSLIEFIIAKYKKTSFITSMPSVFIITCATFLLLQGYSYIIYFISANLGLISRHLLKTDNRPIFNPANFGLIVTLLLFANMGGAFADQWTGATFMVAMILALGTVTTIAAKRLVITVSYVLAFATFALLQWAIFPDRSPFLLIGSLISPASLLFCFHMISDPRTTPDSKRNQVYFAACVALVDFLFRVNLVVYAQFIALTLVCAAYCFYKSSFAIKSRAFVSLLFLIGSIAYALKVQNLPIKDPFMDPKNDVAWSEPLTYAFKEVARDLGINFKHGIFTPEIKFKDKTKYRELMSAGAYVVDVNQDGFLDLFFTTMEENKPNALYKNNAGLGFENVTSTWGLGHELNFPWPTTGANFSDFNNDGKVDLFLLKKGCHSLYLNTGSEFKDVTQQYFKNPICSDGTAVNVFDFNKDGFLDIYIGNYFKAGALATGQPASKHDERLSYTNYNRDGGVNTLLINNGGKGFETASDSLNLNDTGFALAIGIADLNNDSWPDVYIANDLGVDKILFNSEGKNFVDETRDLGTLLSRNSMSAEIADVDKNGYLDIYVTNLSKAPSRIGRNYLWMNFPTGLRNHAVYRHVDSCGWAWGAKFFDPDRDGNLELMVTNGFYGNPNDKKVWYSYLTLQGLPGFLRTNETFQFKTEGTAIANGQRNCLFKFDKASSFYRNVASSAGILDELNGRGLALADIDNDGSQDLILANFMESPLIYKNEYKGNSDWVGIQFVSSQNMPIDGSKIQAYCGDKLYFNNELYPSNGFNSQSDSRIVIGLGGCDESVTIKVKSLYSDKIESISFKRNQYNKIVM